MKKAAIEQAFEEAYNLGLSHAFDIVVSNPKPQALAMILKLKGKPEITELDSYSRWQLETKGNILPSNEEGVFESGTEEANRFSEWNRQMAEQELLQYEKYDHQ